MKRVLMVSCGGLGRGGVQSIMMGIVRSLSSEYHFDMLLFTSETRYYDQEFLSYGGKIFRIPPYKGKSRMKQRISSYLTDFNTYRQINKILDTQDPYDVIHCNNQFESAPLLKAAYKHSIPVRICHTHIIEEETGLFLSVINKIRRKFINRYATHCIGCSKEACESLFSNKIQSEVIPNFYDDSKYYFEPLPSCSNQLVLTQLGAYTDNKNQLFSIKVAKNLKVEGVNVVLNFIGFKMEPKYEERLIEEVSKQRLSDNVVFHPGDAIIPDIFKRTHVLLMPSKSEGFGIALIEAQAVGIHCLASSSIPQTTDCGGVTFLDIYDRDAPRRWAEIIKEAKNEGNLGHELLNTTAFKQSVVMNIFDNLYKQNNSL